MWLLTWIVLLLLLEIIEINPTTVDVQLVINNSRLMGIPPTEAVSWGVGDDPIDQENNY